MAQSPLHRSRYASTVPLAENRMIRSSLAVVLVASTLAGCGGDGGGGGPAPSGAALLANTSYVDYDPTNDSSEASNLEKALTTGTNLWDLGISGIGVDVLKFQGASATGLRQAVAGRRLLVIPELERGPLAPDLDFEAITVLRDFVNGGGVVLLCGDFSSYDLPVADAILGTTLQVGYSPNLEEPAQLDAGAANGTPFAGGPLALQSNDGSNTLLASSLPAGAKALYTVGGDSLVTLFPKGSGYVLVMGWDWFIDLIDETPDIANWVDVLKRATQL
jgi:hypothetical protein